MLAALATCAHAQTIAPSQIVPHGPPDAVTRAQPSTEVPVEAAPLPLKRPENATALPVRLSLVDIAGAFPELDTDNQATRAALTGRAVTLADMYDAADRLEQAYARAGYILARVTLPPQRIVQNGVLHLQVVDGYIDTIVADGVPTSMRRLVEKSLAPLVGKRHLRRSELERRLLVAGELPGLNLRSALRAGAETGSAQLAVEGTFRRANAALALDNSLPASLGREQAIVSLAVNSLTGRGEQIYVMAGQQADLGRFGFAQSPFAMVGTGLVLPLGHYGLQLAGDYLHSRTRPARIAGVPATIGTFDRAGLRLGDYALLTHDQRLRFSAGADLITQVQDAPLFGLMLSRDHYIALRLGAEWRRSLPDGGQLTGSLDFSHGLDGRNAPSAAATPFSRLGANSHFSRVEARFSLRQPIGRATFTFTARGQSAFGRPLFLSEQFTLASADGVSALTPGSVNTDSGLSVRAELSRTILPARPRGLALQPYVFGASGLGWLHRATAAETGSLSLQGLGAGLRLYPDARSGHLSFSVELGRSFGGGLLPEEDRLRANMSAHLGF